MRKMITVLALVVLVACGSSPAGPSAVPTPVPTPTPPPNHSGAYAGSAMTWTDENGTLGEVHGTLTVTHDTVVLLFSELRLTHAAADIDASFGMGSASLDAAEHFTGVTAYTSSGCGLVTVRTSGWFAGEAMNLTTTLTSPRCQPVTIRGEMRR